MGICKTILQVAINASGRMERGLKLLADKIYSINKPVSHKVELYKIR